MYEILELFINTKIDGKLFIIARNKGKNCSRSHKRTIISSYTPQIIKDKGIENLHEYIKIIDTDLAEIQDTPNKDAYLFIRLDLLIYLPTKNNGKRF
jgi:hypothetical protein